MIEPLVETYLTKAKNREFESQGQKYQRLSKLWNKKGLVEAPGSAQWNLFYYRLHFHIMELRNDF